MSREDFSVASRCRNRRHALGDLNNTEAGGCKSEIQVSAGLMSPEGLCPRPVGDILPLSRTRFPPCLSAARLPPSVKPPHGIGFSPWELVVLYPFQGPISKHGHILRHWAFGRQHVIVEGRNNAVTVSKTQDTRWGLVRRRHEDLESR